MFRDRREAGRRLAEKLAPYGAERPIVLGLPRGGMIVAAEIASALRAELDVLLVRKVGMPGAEEFAIGAVAPDMLLLDQPLVARLGIPRARLAELVGRERIELARRDRLYRGGRAQPDVTGRTVIVADDGLATGATARAAIESLRRRGPARIVFAAPVCSPEGATTLAEVADEVVCLARPVEFRAVGLWYTDFTPTTDAEVIACLHDSRARQVSA